MSYIIQWSDNALKVPISLSDNVSDNTSTTLVLTGRGFVNWGQPLQQNLMHLLENFASYGVTPLAPTDGQIWYNADPASNRLNVNIGSGWSELAWRRIDLSTAPTYITYSGDMWYDTTYNVFNVFNSSTASWSRIAYNSQVMGNYSLDTGVANAYVVTLVPAVMTNYTNSFVGRFKVANTNTGSCTIDAGGGPVPLYSDLGIALVAGDLQIGMIASYIYVYQDNAAYITSIVQSQMDLRYAKLAGLNTQVFRVHDAVGPNDAVAFLQLQNLLSFKAPLLSPGLTGIPTAPTAAPGTNTTQIATTAFVTDVKNTLTTYVQNYTPVTNGIGSRCVASSATNFMLSNFYTYVNVGPFGDYHGLPSVGTWLCESGWKVVANVVSTTTVTAGGSGWFYSTPSTSATSVSVSYAYVGMFIRVS